MNKDTLKKYKEALIKKEELIQDFNRELERKEEVFEKENEFLIQNIAEIKNEITRLAAIIEVEAEKEYRETGSKKLLGGIGIRIGTKLEYFYDNALDWAKKHQLCLSLDTKAFEKIAKTQEIEFVEKIETVKVTFPKEIILEEEN